MGGKGSGRLNKTDAFMRDAVQRQSPITKDSGGEPIFLPNHSGKHERFIAGPGATIYTDISNPLFLGLPKPNITKYSYIVSNQYDSDSEPEGFLMMGGVSNNAVNNNLFIGGGSSSHNVASNIDFYTFSDTTTRTGNRAMTIASDQNVGIGTNAPANKLHVKTGTDENLRIRQGSDLSGANGIMIQSINDADSSLRDLVLRANSVLMSGGNVGIGTTSPETLLEISSTDDPVMTFYNTTESNANNARKSTLKFKGEKADTTKHTLGILQFKHFGAGDDEKGFLTLSLNSGAEGDNPSTVFNMLAGNASFVASDVRVDNNNFFQSRDAAGSYRNLIGVTGGDDVTIGSTNYDDILFTVGSLANAMVIKETTGDVGIGTTNPSAELEVADSSATAQIKVTGAVGQGVFQAGGGAIGIGSVDDRQVQFLQNGINVTNIDTDGDWIFNKASTKLKSKEAANGNARLFFTCQRTDASDSGFIMQTKNAVSADTARLRIGTGAATVEASFEATNVTFGSASNNFNVSSGGKSLYTGSGGMVFGEIYAHDNSTETTITTAGTKVQVTIFDTDGQASNTSPSHSQDHITTTKAGIYLVTVSLTADSVSGAGAEFDFQVYKNNGATAFDNAHAHRSFAGGGGEIGSVSISGLIPLDANDTVEVWVTNDTNTQNIIVSDITLSLVQVGGNAPPP